MHTKNDWKQTFIKQVEWHKKNISYIIHFLSIEFLEMDSFALENATIICHNDELSSSLT